MVPNGPEFGHKATLKRFDIQVIVLQNSKLLYFRLNSMWYLV
jgi:hypothetical protein